MMIINHVLSNCGVVVTNISRTCISPKYSRGPFQFYRFDRVHLPNIALDTYKVRPILLPMVRYMQIYKTLPKWVFIQSDVVTKGDLLNFFWFQVVLDMFALNSWPLGPYTPHDQCAYNENDHTMHYNRLICNRMFKRIPIYQPIKWISKRWFEPMFVKSNGYLMILIIKSTEYTTIWQLVTYDILFNVTVWQIFGYYAWLA